MKRLKNNWLWLLTVSLVTLVSLGTMFAPQVQANSSNDTHPATPLLSFTPVSFTPDQQIFNDDLVVESGQVINENVTVFNGSATVREGGAIRGNLTVFRGDVEIAGEVGGNLAVMGGDVGLRSSARVEGNVSIFGGTAEREEGAYVGGNFVGGPGGRFPEIPDDVRGVNIQPPATNPASGLLHFFLRLLQAAFWTLVIAGLVTLLVWLLPNQVKAVSRTATADPALSFATGLIVTLAVIFLAFVLSITICLAPAAILLIGLLLLVGVAGWTVTAYLSGQRLQSLLGARSTRQFHPLIATALGALLLTGITAFGWAISQCLGILLATLFGSIGTGAVLVHLARRRTSTTGGESGPEGDGGEPTPPAPAAPPAQETPEGEEGEEVPAEMEDEDLGPDREEAWKRQQLGSDVQDEDVQDEEESEATSEELPPGLETSAELDLTAEEAESLRQGAETPEAADFTRIRGIGPTFDRRLKEANVRTFAQLAAMTPEAISEILGWSPERVIRDQLIEQAQELAQ